MPRSIDYTQGNETDWNEVRFPEPHYGKNELTIENVNALTEATGALCYSFDPQFSTYGKPDPENRPQTMDAAHEWLSQNATGPWFWHESWSNHGHHVDTHVYIERLPDQKAFAGACENIFGYHPNSDYDLHKVAVLRGTLPLFTPKESFLVWRHENSGHIIENIDDKADPRIVRFTFTIPALEEKFKADWGDEFTAKAITPTQNSYTGPWIYGRNFRDRDMGVWLSKNGAIGDMSMGGGFTTFAARYPETIAALKKDWGHVFTWSGDRNFIIEAISFWNSIMPKKAALTSEKLKLFGSYGKLLAFRSTQKAPIFIAADYPSSPVRAIPDDFMAYLRGEREDYATPYAASLLPKRAVTAVAQNGGRHPEPAS